MKAKIEIEMNGAAFDGEPATELARILTECVSLAEQGCTKLSLRDINGNTVGKFEVFNGEQTQSLVDILAELEVLALSKLDEKSTIEKRLLRKVRAVLEAEGCT